MLKSVYMSENFRFFATSFINQKLKENVRNCNQSNSYHHRQTWC